MSSFKQNVTEVVAGIKFGNTLSYGEVAALAGSPRAAQAVGTIARTSTNSGMPWHRVVRADGSLAPGFAWGGAIQQQKMLEQEGVVFSVDRKIIGWINE